MDGGPGFKRNAGFARKTVPSGLNSINMLCLVKSLLVREVDGNGLMVGGMSGQFWLGDEAWAAIEPRLSKNQPGARWGDDRRVISGIIHVLRWGGMPWRDCPSAYGPPSSIYNRFNRWSRRGIWQRAASGPLGGWADR